MAHGDQWKPSEALFGTLESAAARGMLTLGALPEEAGETQRLLLVDFNEVVWKQASFWLMGSVLVRFEQVGGKVTESFWILDRGQIERMGALLDRISQGRPRGGR